MNLPEMVRASRSFFPLHVLYVSCHQKLSPRFSMGLFASNDPIKKDLHRCAQLLGVLLVPDVVKLTTRISHHRRHPMPCIFAFSFNNSCFLGATLCTQASQFCFNYLLRLYFEVKFINQGFSYKLDIPVDYLLARLLRLNPLALSIPFLFMCVLLSLT